MPSGLTENRFLLLFVASILRVHARHELKSVFEMNTEWKNNPATPVQFDCKVANATALLVEHEFHRAKPGVNKTGFLLSHSGPRKGFIETGTNDGRNIKRIHSTGHFDYVSSIEFSPFYFQHVNKSIGHLPRLKLYEGDSGEMLPQVLDDLEAKVSGGAVIWLDAHYSLGRTAGAQQAEPPIFKEILAILNSKYAEDHIILIDDVRLWTGTLRYSQIYPSPHQVQQLVCSKQPNAEFRYENDALAIWIKH